MYGQAYMTCAEIFSLYVQTWNSTWEQQQQQQQTNPLQSHLGKAASSPLTAVLAVKCPMQTSSITQPPVRYIHTTQTDTRRRYMALAQRSAIKYIKFEFCLHIEQKNQAVHPITPVAPSNL